MELEINHRLITDPRSITEREMRRKKIIWRLNNMLLFPRWFSVKESACQCKRCRFDPLVGKIPWRRKWQPTLVFLPGKSHGQRSLAVYSLWGHKVSHMTQQLTTTTTKQYATKKPWVKDELKGNLTNALRQMTMKTQL